MFSSHIRGIQETLKNTSDHLCSHLSLPLPPIITNNRLIGIFHEDVDFDCEYHCHTTPIGTSENIWSARGGN
ncbi:hypothetical protein CMV_004813 [Castanea mollissima]|uniref:Uncharacterized protein n=1 Tax=Castanea mollissima TaxID=60419 RepID=A0A8J4RRA8_9ROSI|nr:hypothetical protein CMV_004813 [Castanea mollissima]